MESVLRLLPPRPQPLIVRYGFATLIVAVSGLLFIGLRGTTGFDGAFLFFPGIFLASILFDRGSGFYATGLSVLFIYYQLYRPGDDLLAPDRVLPVTLFAILAVALATVSEAMRKAWERAVAAEKAKDLLLQELGHRTKNNLALVTSVLSLQARSLSNPESKSALENAVARVHVIANAHEFLNPHQGHELIEMRGYLEELCKRLGEALRDVRPIAVRVEADPIELASERAVAIGLIVNELVTNAFKYAFPQDQSGAVTVALTRASPPTLRVEDNGIGCAEQMGEGTGTKLVRLLVQQLGGRIKWTPANPGCRVIVTIGETG